MYRPQAKRPLSGRFAWGPDRSGAQLVDYRVNGGECGFAQPLAALAVPAVIVVRQVGVVLERHLERVGEALELVADPVGGPGKIGTAGSAFFEPCSSWKSGEASFRWCLKVSSRARMRSL